MPGCSIMPSGTMTVAEGSVGAGAGTIAFSWKGGIGTSSRVLPKVLGGYTVGVLVQGLWVDGDRHATLTRLAFVFVTQQVFVGDDV